MLNHLLVASTDADDLRCKLDGFPFLDVAPKHFPAYLAGMQGRSDIFGPWQTQNDKTIQRDASMGGCAEDFLFGANFCCCGRALGVRPFEDTHAIAVYIVSYASDLKACVVPAPFSY